MLEEMADVSRENCACNDELSENLKFNYKVTEKY